MSFAGTWESANGLAFFNPRYFLASSASGADNINCGRSIPEDMGFAPNAGTKQQRIKRPLTTARNGQRLKLVFFIRHPAAGENGEY
jgi:hypothetical protein